MRTLAIGLSGAVLALIAAGCGPQLAEMELGPEEQQWNQYIKQSYSSYRPPHTTAPGAKGKNGAAVPGATAEKDVVCEGIVVEESIIDPVDGVVIEDEVIFVGPVPIEKEKEPVAAGDDAAKETGVPEPEVKASVEYVVQHGDTLSGIAKKFYKDGTLFDRIFEANRDVLANPNVLKPGTKLRIPAKQ